MQVTIPKPIVNELFNRLEEMGAYDPTDEAHTLYIKVRKALVIPKVELSETELKELKYHCGIMVELGVENEGDEEYELEARYAKQLLRQLKGATK